MEGIPIEKGRGWVYPSVGGGGVTLGAKETPTIRAKETPTIRLGHDKYC